MLLARGWGRERLWFAPASRYLPEAPAFRTEDDRIVVTPARSPCGYRQFGDRHRSSAGKGHLPKQQIPELEEPSPLTVRGNEEIVGIFRSGKRRPFRLVERASIQLTHTFPLAPIDEGAAIGCDLHELPMGDTELIGLGPKPHHGRRIG